MRFFLTSIWFDSVCWSNQLWRPESNRIESQDSVDLIFLMEVYSYICSTFTVKFPGYCFLFDFLLVLVCIENSRDMTTAYGRHFLYCLNCKNPRWEDLASRVWWSWNIYRPWCFRSTLFFPLIHHYLPWPTLCATKSFLSSVKPTQH